MIKLGLKKMENVVILKLVEGSYDELNKIQINGLLGLGGFSIKETITYLLNTKDSGYSAYNFRNTNEAEKFSTQLKQQVKEINGGEKGVFKMKYVLVGDSICE